MKDIRLEVKFRNNLILRRIEEAGFRSLSGFCAAKGVKSYSELSAIVSMRTSPLLSNGVKWKSVVRQTALALGCAPEDLFSEQTIRKRERTRYSLEASAADAMRLISGEKQRLPDAGLIEGDLRRSVSEALAGLTDRERLVLSLRFGLDGRDDHTLREVADRLGVTKERIRQVESKALRKLRHPTRRRALEAFA